MGELDYITTKEAAEKWGYSEGTIRKWCNEGLLFIVARPIKKSGRWQIPADAECPNPIKKLY